MNKKKWWLIAPLVLLIAYLIGPHPSSPVYSTEMPVVPADPALLEQKIRLIENSHHLKPDNEARIVWADDSLKQVTDYSIVYLHGFTASQAEGDPVHRHIARTFGCNLYLSRLAEHGIDTTEPLANLTADNYWESAKVALSIGRRIGKKVILMGTSTGATLAIKLAAIYPDIASIVLLSPNIAINDPNAWLINNPWGMQIASMVTGGKYMDSKDQRVEYKKYWTHHYRLEGAVALQELLETSMTKVTFAKVHQPVLLLYYYKDEQHQDAVVKVSAMKEMFSALGTPANAKRAIAVPGAGDHVIGSYIRSKDLATVESEVKNFLQEMLRMHPSIRH